MVESRRGRRELKPIADGPTRRQKTLAWVLILLLLFSLLAAVAQIFAGDG